MSCTLSESSLSILPVEAVRAAARLSRRLALSRADLDDLGQELLLDLIRRFPAFDPSRGSIGALANIILRNASSRIVARIVRERRAWGGAALSLDQPGENGLTLGDGIADEDGLSVWHGQTHAEDLAVERRIDVARALSALSPEDRALCAALAVNPVRALVDRGFGSRSQLYRRIAELRCTLAAHGLGPRGTVCGARE